MTYEEMLEVWRAQDETPRYSVNPGLLQAVVEQEQAGLRRRFGWEWFVPAMLWFVAGAMLAVAFAILFAANARGWVTSSVWDYVAAGIATGAMLLWPVAYWAGHERRPPRERDFGSSLQEEIQRNLSWVDHQLSRYGRLGPWLLRSAPIWVAVIMFVWVGARMIDKLSGWIIFLIAAWPAFLPLFSSGHYQKKQLLAYRRRLTELLDLLNAGEWKDSEWPVA
jgi:hypothetical protein